MKQSVLGVVAITITLMIAGFIFVEVAVDYPADISAAKRGMFVTSILVGVLLLIALGIVAAVRELVSRRR